MASQNLVSGVLTDETLSTALAGIQSLTESMNFLISLSPDERRRITKLKGGHVDFVREIRDVCNQNPGFLPRQFDLEEFDRDVALANQLDQVETALSTLARQMEDTLMAVRSDMYSSALEAYGYLQVARDGDGLDGHRNDLRQYFRHRRSGSGADVDETEAAGAL